MARQTQPAKTGRFSCGWCQALSQCPWASLLPSNRKVVFIQLDQLVLTMRSLTGVQSGSKIHIINYSGGCEGEYGKKLLASGLMTEMKQYLLQKKGVLANQLVLTDGGVMEKF